MKKVNFTEMKIALIKVLGVFIFILGGYFCAGAQTSAAVSGSGPVDKNPIEYLSSDEAASELAVVANQLDSQLASTPTTSASYKRLLAKATLYKQIMESLNAGGNLRSSLEAPFAEFAESFNFNVPADVAEFKAVKQEVLDSVKG